MEKNIAFPNIGLDFNISSIAFSLFGRDVYWYGVIIATGLILAAIYTTNRTREFNLKEDSIMDMLFLAVPMAVICGRLYYVIFEWSYYSKHLNEIVAIWNGGIAIYGAIIGAVIALLIYARYSHTNAIDLMDLGGLGLLIGQSIGRWGNFVNGEAFGGETDLPWAMSINGASTVHPTFLYESLWNALGFVILHFYSKKRKIKGEIFLLYVAWYGIGRGFIEGMRTDSLYLGPIRVSQALGFISAIVAVAIIIYRRKTYVEVNTSVWNSAFVHRDLTKEEEVKDDN